MASPVSKSASSFVTVDPTRPFPVSVGMELNLTIKEGAKEIDTLINAKVETIAQGANNGTVTFYVQRPPRRVSCCSRLCCNEKFVKVVALIEAVVIVGLVLNSQYNVV